MITYLPLRYSVETEKLIIPEIDNLFNNDKIYEFVMSPLIRNPLYNGRYKTYNEIIMNDDILANVSGSMITRGMTVTQKNTEWQEYTCMLRTARKWNQNKVIYQLNSDFEKELMKTSGKCKIPYKMLENLPTDCFYIEFQDGTDFKEYNGFYVNIVKWFDKYLICANRITHNEICYHFFIAMGEHVQGFGTEEYEDENGEKGFIFNGEIKNIAHDGMEFFKDADCVNEMLVRDNTLVLQFITYLCAENADINLSEESKRTYRPSDRVKNKYSEIRKYEVGYKFGKVFKEYKKRKQVDYPDGTTKRPHLRRAHWHTYYKGKGKTETIIHWLSEIMVHEDLIES